MTITTTNTDGVEMPFWRGTANVSSASNVLQSFELAKKLKRGKEKKILRMQLNNSNILVCYLRLIG